MSCSPRSRIAIYSYRLALLDQEFAICSYRIALLDQGLHSECSENTNDKNKSYTKLLTVSVSKCIQTPLFSVFFFLIHKCVGFFPVIL